MIYYDVTSRISFLKLPLHYREKTVQKIKTANMHGTDIITLCIDACVRVDCSWGSGY